ncbi:hypothetical protein SUGI_0357220 [Cryptomeria japonica]|nr:hypothetical protein SUGI_0357220 [Cryptomeria japonica]
MTSKSRLLPQAITERHGFSSESGLLMQEQQFVFSLEMLAEATENFHYKNKLEHGAFGAIYKGITRNGDEIAVKKLSAKSVQGNKEFMNEVKLVANVQHRNLAKLLGCCAEGSKSLLVYEYFPNKSLDTFLFDSEKGRELDWQKRYNIIIGIAHETHIRTGVAGTYVCMAPEYAMRGQLSIKVDIYSFGVVVLEIISGRKNTDTNLPHRMQNLSSAHRSQTLRFQPPHRPSSGRDDAWRRRSASPPRCGSGSGWPSDAPVAFAPLPAVDSRRF